MNSIVTLLSDFGMKDHYVAAMKGQILKVNPKANCFDITHKVPVHDVEAAAFILSVAWKNFPEGTVHLCVVDPGVGSDRRPMALFCQGHYFVGPDNGLFTHVIRESSELNARELSRPDLFNSSVSNTFHGRDLFAPVAGHLSYGIPFEQLGSVIENPVELNVPNVEIDNGEIRGSVIHIDHFGNVITNITLKHLEMSRLDKAALELEYFDKKITNFFESYAEAGSWPFIILGSSGFLECSIKNESAAEWMGFERGNRVIIRRRSD